MAEYRDGPNGEKWRQIVAAEDVDEHVIKAAEEALEWFTDDGPIDWEEFFDRMDGYVPDDYELPGLDNPAARKIKRHIREIRANS